MTRTLWIEQDVTSAMTRAETTSGRSILDLLGQTPGTSDRMLDVRWRQMRQSNRAHATQLVKGHRQTFMEGLAANAHEIVKIPIRDALQELSNEWGMAWADVARMVGVSVPALRKWRVAGGASGENHRKVAELLAFIRVLHEVGVHEPAAWISIPMVDGYTVTPRHLYGSSSAPILLDVASSSASPGTALDELSPGWRETFATEFEVTTAADGQPAVVNRRQTDG